MYVFHVIQDHPVNRRSGRAREYFESSAAELTSPPDMEAALALAARHDVETMPAE